MEKIKCDGCSKEKFPHKIQPFAIIRFVENCSVNTRKWIIQVKPMNGLILFSFAAYAETVSRHKSERKRKKTTLDGFCESRKIVIAQSVSDIQI